MAYWLFKTEPDTFSIQTLRVQKTSCWEGVRNYQARNMMRDEVKLGDLEKEVRVNLQDRSRFEYSMILGKNFLKHGAVVSSNEDYLLGEMD